MRLSKQVPLPFLALSVTILACSGISGLFGNGGDGGGGDGGGGEGGGGGQVIFSDDFGDTGTGWEVGDYQTGSVGYQSGGYFVTSLGDGDTMWGAAGRSFRDVVIDVDATQLSGPSNDNNDYGVVCRLQEDGDGYYLLISGDGFFSILLGDGEGFDSLVEWTESSVIVQGNASNHIRAICQGSRLTLIVNGQELASTTDSTFSSGDLGLTATSYETGESTTVSFDNLVVRQP